MKKFKFTGSIKLNKEVISKLQDKQMLDIQGGKAAVGRPCSKGDMCSCTDGSCNTKAAVAGGV